MAQFTLEQLAEIERRIQVHVGVQAVQFGQILADGRAQVEEARAFLGTHDQELHANADRVTNLVEQLNAKEGALAQLTKGISDFATQQEAQALDVGAKAAAQSAGLERLTRQNEAAMTKLDQALLGFGAKSVNAVEECKTFAVGEIDVLRSQMYTYSVGAKAEINEIIGVL